MPANRHRIKVSVHTGYMVLIKSLKPIDVISSSLGAILNKSYSAVVHVALFIHACM